MSDIGDDLLRQMAEEAEATAAIERAEGRPVKGMGGVKGVGEGGRDRWVCGCRVGGNE